MEFFIHGKREGQAATDFMISYGIAILIISISVYVIVRLGVFSNSLAQPTCVAEPSFACGTAVLNANGLLTFTLTQAVGGAINITGVACSSAANSIGNFPQYGNLYVQSYSAVPGDYPTSALQYGDIVYSDATAQLQVWCYGSGGISTTNLGSPYTGYVWINYTYSGLPARYFTVQRAMQFTTRSG